MRSGFRVQGSGVRGQRKSTWLYGAPSLHLSISHTLILAALVLLVPATVHAQDAKQRLFTRVFGDAVRLDPAMVAKVKAGKPGEQHFVDTDGDGRNDECWFIDTSPRHTPKLRPILVRTIDEDGDLDAYKGPDLDSDLYVVDYHADGTVDAVLDYQDNDGDNDVDEMAFYFFMAEHPFFGKNVLRVWWGRDDGDDNLLWYDEDYTYYQPRCQYRCHFAGDETFVAFGLTEDSNEWLSAFENPFLFYDLDGEGSSEVTLRIEGKADAIRAIRYSFDADDDAGGRRAYDYEFSITALADEDKLVKIPPEMLESTRLRGIPTQGWLRRDKARAFVEQAAWSKVMLTWDELNANTEQDFTRDPHERWEGVIAHGNDEFRQVGGPPCSVFNKRYELSLAPKAPLGLYLGSDARIHLKGASKGWLDVDYNLDGKLDSKYTWADEDGDGIFDRRRFDLDADGKFELEWQLKADSVRPVDLQFESISQAYLAALQRSLLDSQAFIDAAYTLIGRDFPNPATLPQSVQTPQAAFFLHSLPSWMPATRLGERVRKTPAGARLYVELVRDQLFTLQKAIDGSAARIRQAEPLYAAGEFQAAAKALLKGAPAGAELNVMRFGTFQRRIPIRIEGPKGRREDWPVVVDVAAIQAVAGDFDPQHCAVVAPERWLDWRQVAHQVDVVDSLKERRLSFLADLPPGGAATYYLYYLPTGQETKQFPRRTATAQDWVPPNIGWESNRCAYRAYWGQFDFFGKKTEQLIYPTIGNKSYHAETEWGIDALNVKKASGLGGLTLYHEGKPYLVQNPAGQGTVKFEKRELASGPIRAVIEITADNIIPDKSDVSVKMTCIIYAEHQETEIRVQVTGLDGETLLAPGFIKLLREQAFIEPERGVWGSWGFQEEVIGDIGMGLVFDPKAYRELIDLPEERRVVLSTSDGGRLRYWLIGDWRRGRQYPIAPTVDNWKRDMRELAGVLLNEPKITIGKPEELKTEN